jgi:hypothetical protein
LVKAVSIPKPVTCILRLLEAYQKLKVITNQIVLASGLNRENALNKKPTANILGALSEERDDKKLPK